MRRFPLILILLLLAAVHGWALGDWNLVKFEGRDYVSLANVGRFYQLGPLQQSGSNLFLRAGTRCLRGQLGSPEFYINNLKFILSYPVSEVGGQPSISRMDLTKLLEPVLRPSRIPNSVKVNTIILDPGHGGHDNGAASLFGNEKSYALDVALRTRDLLKTAGFQVYMTRSTDRFVPLEERAAFASRYPNALFISIHFNSSGNEATGVETFTLAPRGVPSMAADGPSLSDFVPCPGNGRDAENIALACATHATLVYNSAMFDRGIKRARFVVLRESMTPGVLIEGGFLSNPNDARRIATAAYRQQMAGSILQAVQNYRSAVGTRPTVPMATASNDVNPVNGINDNVKPNVPVVITTPSARQ
jgi:N-acetylmuramoyl-L-alanine amidase